MLNNKRVHKQVCIFNETHMNTFSNFTPNKLVTFDDRDPPWMNDFVKSKIKWKSQLYKICTKNVYKCNDYLRLKDATILVSQVIAVRKEDYHNIIASKFNNWKTIAKAYWSILKTFHNGQKIPVIPPLLINNELISDFNSKLSSLQFENNDDIIKIIRSLDTSAAHGHDDISIRMLKICDLAIRKTLPIIFRNSINHSAFPDLWTKSNICPIHKKGDKQVINNYRPVSLLPIFGKIFERLIFNSLLEYIEKYKLLSVHQSAF